MPLFAAASRTGAPARQTGSGSQLTARARGRLLPSRIGKYLQSYTNKVSCRYATILMCLLMSFVIGINKKNELGTSYIPTYILFRTFKLILNLGALFIKKIVGHHHHYINCRIVCWIYTGPLKKVILLRVDR